MRLLEPLALRSVVAPNRVLFGPHETNLGDGRALSARHLAYYERRMAGGTGLLVTEVASVHPSDWPYERAPAASACGEGWAALARAAAHHGTVVLAGLGHAGGQGSSAYHQRELWAPSPVPEVNTREVPKVMEAGDIAAVVDGFGAAAARARHAGLAGVEINAGQHSLVRQFLSGLTNLRGDDHGVDRLRFARDVLDAAREGLGPHGVLALRLSCDELAPWAGITPDAAVEVAVALAPAIDLLVVTRGSIFSVAATRPDEHAGTGVNLVLAATVQAGLRAAGCRVPVFAQGSIIDVAEAEAAVSGGLDGVEMTRAQLADARLVAKLRIGDAHRVRPCVLCNQRCMVRDNRNPIVSCIVDPRSGHELTDPDVDTPPALARPQPVTVVGAGVAGLEAARVAAIAGAPVRVLEAAAVPGGMAVVAAHGAGRSRLATFVAWLESECRTLGVEIELGRQVDRLDQPGPTVVATGSIEAPPAFEVADGAVVMSAAAYLSRAGAGAGAGAGADDGWPAGPVGVWDPIGGPVAVSVAETLLASGRAVTLITPDMVVGTMLALSGDLAPANVRLQAGGATLVKRAVVRTVSGDGVTIEDRFSGEERLVPVVALVDCDHRLPDPGPAPGTAAPVAHAGDCVAPRSIGEAVLEGRRAVLAVLGS